MYTQNEEKSKEELNELKKEWEKNPHWDIFTSPGFEAHEKHLRNYQKQTQIQKEEVSKRQERMAAKSMGFTLETYRRWKELKGIAETYRNQSANMMLHLVYGTHKVDDEMRVIVEAIVDSIFRGAINYAKAEMVHDTYAIP